MLYPLLHKIKNNNAISIYKDEYQPILCITFENLEKITIYYDIICYFKYVVEKNIKVCVSSKLVYIGYEEDIYSNGYDTENILSISYYNNLDLEDNNYLLNINPIDILNGIVLNGEYYKLNIHISSSNILSSNFKKKKNKVVNNNKKMYYFLNNINDYTYEYIGPFDKKYTYIITSDLKPNELYNLYKAFNKTVPHNMIMMQNKKVTYNIKKMNNNRFLLYITY